MSFGTPGDEARHQVGHLVMRLEERGILTLDEARSALFKVYPEFDDGVSTTVDISALRKTFERGATISSIPGEVREIFDGAARALGAKP